jgi:hypothetical protein
MTATRSNAPKSAGGPIEWARRGDGIHLEECRAGPGGLRPMIAVLSRLLFASAVAFLLSGCAHGVTATAR